MPARLYLLTAGAFAIGTSAYVITGLIPAISAELGVTPAVVGQLSTAFALAYAVGAPLIATLTGRWDRRLLLVVALGVAAAGNLLSAVAPTFSLLLSGRVLAALGAAAFTPTATLVAAGLMPPEQRGRAVAVVFGGLTLALALGVPVGGLLGDAMGFRGVHVVLAVFSIVIAGLAARVVPSVPPPPPTALRDRLAVAADRRALTLLALTVVGVVATMTIYIYLVPLLAATAGVTGAVASGLLLTYGVGAMIGNNLGGRAADRYGATRIVLVIMLAFTLLVFTFSWTATTTVLAGIVLLVWGGFTWAFNPPIQSLLVEIGGQRASLLVSLNASAIYLGFGIAGGLGGVVLDRAGPLALPWVSTALAVVGLALGLSLVRARERVPVG